MAKSAVIRQATLAVVFLAVGAAAAHWGPEGYRRVMPYLSGPTSTTLPSTRPMGGGEEAAHSADTWVVRRGELRVVFTESGKLRAVKSYPIIPQVSRYQLKITFLAAEGSQVKKGDLIASFDKKQFEDLLQTKQAELDGATRGLTVAQSALVIAESTGRTAVSQAGTKLDDAKVLLKTYTEMEGPKKLNELDKTLLEARNKLTDSAKTVTEAKQKIDDGLFSEDAQKKILEQQLSNAKENKDSLQKSVESFVQQRKIFRTYEYPQSVKNKKQAVESALMEVEKAKISAENDLMTKRAELAKVEDTIKRLKREIESNQDLISKSDMTAPIDGLVVYGDASSPFRYYGNDIKVGAEWYGGQTLMTIPDLTAFEIDVNVAEDYVGRVKEGNLTAITFDAVPGLKLAGKLKEIAKMGQPRDRFDPSGPRVFQTAVALDATDPRLVSGMTGKVEILADRADDVLTVPVDAIASDDGKTFAMVRVGPAGSERLEKRLVMTGRSNNSLVEITSGLDVGDRVALGAGLSTGAASGSKDPASAGMPK